jgi:hypothetical protein
MVRFVFAFIGKASFIGVTRHPLLALIILPLEKKARGSGETKWLPAVII